MKILGFEITRAKAQSVLSSVTNYMSGYFGPIRESFAGAWQHNVVCESRQNLTAFSAVYACIAIIADDVAKLRIKLMEQDSIGIWTEVQRTSPFVPVLVKPNRYQTRIQFLTYWIASKLLYGNAYILKERDQRGIVVALYCLDPRMVTPLVSDDGSVYYQINQDHLSGVVTGFTAPSSEIIHDRCVCLFHPLIGVSPIYACGASATQGIRIQANASKFFENMSRPSGQLTAPGKITDETAARLKREFEERFSGANMGRMFVAGDGLKYEAMTMPATDSQLIQQLDWTVQDVSRAFRVPLYKLSTPGQVTMTNTGALNQDYYSQTLQTHIESIELLLDEGLGLVDVAGHVYGTELDLIGLLRMDPAARADSNQKAINAGYLAPNEARFSENLGPKPGGNSPYLQQQHFSLEALAKRDTLPNPFVIDRPATNPTPSPAGPAITADPTQGKEMAETIGKHIEGVVTAAILEIEAKAEVARADEALEAKAIKERESQIFADRMLSRLKDMANA